MKVCVGGGGGWGLATFVVKAFGVCVMVVV